MSFRQRLLAGRPGRFLLGVLAASVVACFTPLPVLLLISYLPKAGLDEITPTLLGDFALGTAAMVFAWPLAVLMTLAGGLPVHLELAALGRQGRLAYAAGGALAGALLLHLLLFAKPLLPLAGALAGGLAALAFRRVWQPFPPDCGSPPQSP
ncbi:hypothetical protein KTR66_03500 [Roseococcus sp. SDR]|uniref:hypothetical protein n=1 Tax=Roseococcus sp. SDR TaxID=2835532 RepID=UPI001BCDA3D6|nr:hypothetical protein [Roseococcus sp. SDR]MBS7789044.1 hypothetical protein [Roseococcus sp. SDR]MBV1844358.1 hypothetical protein [Roseococcus sp. SDR]